MEFGSYKNMHDKNNSSSKRGIPEDDQQDVAVAENPREQPDSSAATPKVNNLSKHDAPPPQNASAEVNIEVPVTADEVIQAGGFGATDDISRILPVVSDFTDFENHLREVRGYEESDDKVAEGQSDPPKAILEAGKNDVKEHVAPKSRDAFEAVNLEASVTSDEVIRAGGFGATDNISSLLPVASDFTDLEANLRDARDYEGLEEKINRPGLGWTSERK